jgi:glycosyltransferase involved in cell wall biosynthesis
MKPPRRVLYLDHTAVMGGGEIALVHLIRHLDRARYAPAAAILSNGPLADELTRAGAQTFLIRAGRDLIDAKKESLRPLRAKAMASAVMTVLRLARVIEQLKIDLVHCNSLKADFLGALAARLTHRPVIWHVRDRIESDYLSPSATRVVRAAANVLPTHIIANSRATLATLRLNDPDRGSVIYSGLDLQQFTQIPERQMGDRPRIGIVGRLAPWKGQHIFLRAAAQLHRRFPRAIFQVVGGPLFSETDYQADLHKLAQTLGIGEATEFTGQRDDVPELLSGMDVVVHASITPEPFGQVAVLAMAAGKPLVATAGGGILEIVAGKKTGLLVPMNDPDAMAQAICRILSDQKLAAEIGRNGRRRAMENFTIDRTAGQVMDLYDRITG